jgi:hypothetical protein
MLYRLHRLYRRLDVDGLLLRYACDAARTLDGKGLKPGQGRLLFQVRACLPWGVPSLCRPVCAVWGVFWAPSWVPLVLVLLLLPPPE